ncbi:hypothetical protein, partial [Klebsiella pneumoniae]|uniref:hypothetical protein n=1 Tax=Klebsiella pneumoniae TaxID=573 RepID=UPI003B59E160
PLLPCSSVAPVVFAARESRLRDAQAVADPVRPSAVAVDRRNTVAVVKPTSAAASSSSPSPSVIKGKTNVSYSFFYYFKIYKR